MNDDIRTLVDQVSHTSVPDQWEEIKVRRPRSEGLERSSTSRGSVRSRVVSAGVAVAVFGAAAIFLGLEVWGGSSPRAAAEAPPAWLVGKALDLARVNGDPHPTSGQWVLTDTSTIQRAFGSLSVGEGSRAYLVVMHGLFVSAETHPSGTSATSGTTMFIVVDPNTHQITDTGVANSDVSVPGLTPFPLVFESNPAVEQGLSSVPQSIQKLALSSSSMNECPLGGGFTSLTQAAATTSLGFQELEPENAAIATAVSLRHFSGNGPGDIASASVTNPLLSSDASPVYAVFLSGDCHTETATYVGARVLLNEDGAAFQVAVWPSGQSKDLSHPFGPQFDRAP